MDFATIKKNLEKHRFTVNCFPNREAAAAHLENTVKGETIGFGGSITVKDMGLYERLGTNNKVIWHWVEQGAQKRFPEFTAYITSANAVSETGELVNIDGSGNRVAASIFGPKKVFFVVGRNKICPDLNAAIDRARTVAGPANAKRINTPTPCVADGRCHDCDSPKRVCGVMSVHMRPMLSAEHTEVVLIDEDLGY